MEEVRCVAATGALGAGVDRDALEQAMAFEPHFIAADAGTNAGPFSLTFDIMFSDEASYQRVKRSAQLNAELVARLYGCPVARVRYFECDNALAFKFSIPRLIAAGDLGDGDLHGGQQFAPLMAIDIS